MKVQWMAGFALLSVACAGTNGSSRVSAKVLALEPGGRDASTLHPLSGARITVHMPDGTAHEAGVTDESGTLLTDVEGVPTTATVTVERAGFVTMNLPVAEACSAWGGSGNNLCRSFQVTTVLKNDGKGVAAAGK